MCHFSLRLTEHMVPCRPAAVPLISIRSACVVMFGMSGKLERVWMITSPLSSVNRLSSSNGHLSQDQICTCVWLEPMSCKSAVPLAAGFSRSPGAESGCFLWTAFSESKQAAAGHIHSYSWRRMQAMVYPDATAAGALCLHQR